MLPLQQGHLVTTAAQWCNTYNKDTRGPLCLKDGPPFLSLSLGTFVSPLPLHIRGASFHSLSRLLRGHSCERLLLPCWIKHPVWIPLPGGLLLPGRKELATPGSFNMKTPRTPAQGKVVRLIKRLAAREGGLVSGLASPGITSSMSVIRLRGQVALGIAGPLS